MPAALADGDHRHVGAAKTEADVLAAGQVNRDAAWRYPQPGSLAG